MSYKGPPDVTCYIRRAGVTPPKPGAKNLHNTGVWCCVASFVYVVGLQLPARGVAVFCLGDGFFVRGVL